MPVEVDSPFCRMNVQGCWQGLLLITKIGSSEHIYNGIDKIALPCQDVLFVIPDVCGEYFCTLR